MTIQTTRSGTRRADAQRNVERILDAAVTCLARRPSATMAEIAKEAGLGRVTLYGHFASRPELVDAVVARVIDRGESNLAAVDLAGDPREALGRLIRTSWQLVDESKSVISAAWNELPAERIQQLHKAPAARVEQLIERGREEGQFRTDMPVTWLVAVLHQILHGAATELAAGNLDAAHAPELITSTVMSLLDRRSSALISVRPPPAGADACHCVVSGDV
ncbi:TetR family transcriptional regulator [Pseudonocardia sediminis]|uniref:TetR family transcriptional regulator n=1 Tax=Pseudonocardia sediminis TaxID=1397368 RepID=A0A4Q7UUM7_PSEST|nr:TetR/AcrR family transcriptional regulator [Pseudonocardia sediminis]RZT85582.1 TetR family transcriptional regulator [Pseudonocardia sediminis]